MNYTIASLNDVNFGQVLTLDKNGNKYVVGLYNEETKEYTHKSFDSIGEAYTIFEKLSRCICFGEYSYSDRKAMIKQSPSHSQVSGDYTGQQGRCKYSIPCGGLQNQ